MANSVWVADASPLFVYSPDPSFFANTQYASGWLGQSTGGTGQNSSYHSTSGLSAVALSGTSGSFQPVFQDANNAHTVQVSVSGGSAQTVESGQTVDAAQGAQANSFVLTVECASSSCADSSFDLLGGWVGGNGDPDGQQSGIQIDDTSPAISYEGFTPVPTDVGNDLQINSDDFHQTLSATVTDGASASVTFQGSTIVVYGVTGPSLGMFTVAIDGAEVGTWSASNNVSVHGVVLFYTSHLDGSVQHSLSIIAKTAGSTTGVVIDSIVAYGEAGKVGFVGDGGSVVGGTTPSGTGPGIGGGGGQSTGSNGTGPQETGHPPQGSGAPNGGVIAGAILGSLAGLILLIWAFRRGVFVMKVKQQQLNEWDEANLLQNQKKEAVHVTTVAKQRYVYPGLIAHSQLKK